MFYQITFFGCFLLVCIIVDLPVSFSQDYLKTEVERDWTYHRAGAFPVSSSSLQPTVVATSNPVDCSYNGKLYLNKQRIPIGNPCIHCFCQRGKLDCFRQNCPPPPNDCDLMSDVTDSCKSPIYNCTIPEKHQMPLLQKETKIYGQRHSGMGLVKGDCIIRGIAYFTGETVGLATSDCLQCHCARNSLLCLPLCCYEPVAFGRDSNQLSTVYHRSLHQRDPHPLDHLN